jgi:hypothetical protein
LPCNRLTAAKARVSARPADITKRLTKKTTDETGSSKKGERHKEKSAAEPTATP